MQTKQSLRKKERERESEREREVQSLKWTEEREREIKKKIKKHDRSYKGRSVREGKEGGMYQTSRTQKFKL